MVFRELVKDALKDLGVVECNTPLNNLLLLEDRWIIELDRDGAFAATVYNKNLGEKDYRETHKLLIFSQGIEKINEKKTEIRNMVIKAIEELQNIVA